MYVMKAMNVMKAMKAMKAKKAMKAIVLDLGHDFFFINKLFPNFKLKQN